MRVAKFNVPVFVLTEFLDYINTKGLKSTIVSKKDDMYNVEIAYAKEQAHIIDEIEELVDVLGILALVFISALSYLVAATQKSRPKKTASSKNDNRKHCFFKDFVTQNVKK